MKIIFHQPRVSWNFQGDFPYFSPPFGVSFLVKNSVAENKFDQDFRFRMFKMWIS